MGERLELDELTSCRLIISCVPIRSAVLSLSLSLSLSRSRSCLTFSCILQFCRSALRVLLVFSFFFCLLLFVLLISFCVIPREARR